MVKHYTENELEGLLVSMYSSDTIKELEEKFGRSLGGIVQKLIELSKEDPVLWDFEKVSQYSKAYRKSYYLTNKEVMCSSINKYQNSELGKETRRKYMRSYRKMHRGKFSSEKKLFKQRNAGKWKEFGDRLKELMTKTGIKNYIAAQKIGINRRTFYDYTSGNCKPADKYMSRLATLLNVNETELRRYFYDEDD